MVRYVCSILTVIMILIVSANADNSNDISAGQDFVNKAATMSDSEIIISENSKVPDKIDSSFLLDSRSFPGYITGIVSDTTTAPLAGVFVLVEGTVIMDTTDANGEYFLGAVDAGEVVVSFVRDGYYDTTIGEVTVNSSDTTELNVELVEDTDAGVLVWYGNLDSSPIEVGLGDVFDVNVYLQTRDYVYVADMLLSLGVQDQYIDSLMSQSDGDIYYPFTEWQVAEFRRSYGSPPNPPGWSSQAFMSFACIVPIPGNPCPWLHTETPILGLKFVLRTANDADNMGHLVHCLGAGVDSIQGYSNAGDTLGGFGFDLSEQYSPLYFAGDDILGQVTNQNGVPIQNVFVEVLDDPHHDYTDIGGHYVLNDLLPGYYDVRFTHPGVTPHTEYNVHVIAGHNTILNVQLQELGNLAGSVTNSDMAPIENVLVEIGGTSYSTYTDYLGYYFFELIETGNYTVYFSHPDYYNQSRNVQITAADTTTLDVIMPYLGALSGLVQDIDAAPLNGVHVVINGTGRDAYTGPDGLFFFDGLDPITYSVTFSHADYNQKTVAGVTIVSADTTDIVVTMEFLAVINGTVTKTDGSILLENVLIQLLQSNVPIESYVTAADGYYEFNHLTQGFYDVRASKAGYVTQTIEDVYAAYDDTIVVDILLVQDIGSIIGDVTGDGLPLDSVHVTAVATVHNDFSDSTGHYEIFDLPGGFYNLKFYKPGYQDHYSMSVQVLPEQTTVVDLAMTEKQYDLALSLFSNPFYRSGQSAYYSCVCRNIGSSTAENVVLQLNLPDDAAYVGSDPAGSYADGVVTWNPGNMSSLDELAFHVDMTISGSVPDGEYLTAGASVSLDNADFDMSNNSVSLAVPVRGSWNSFDKLASPPGAGTPHYIAAGDKLIYSVFFENESGAPGNVTDVIVSDTLDPDLDWDTFTFGAPSHEAGYAANLDYATGVITCTFTGINLPPNTAPPEGEGFINYSLYPNALIEHGEQITNRAAVKFDSDPWVLCPSSGYLLRTIDDVLPASHVNSLPELIVGGDTVTISWTSSDYGGSGIGRIDIYASIDEEPFELVHTSTLPSSQWLFQGEYETCAAFYSVAVDRAGNSESVPAEPDANTCFTYGYLYLPGDANMIAGLWPPQVLGSDVTYLVNYFRNLGQPCIFDDFYASGDANGDCYVIGSDVTYLVNYFRGLASRPHYCPDYRAAWETPEDVPENRPAGWPGCEAYFLQSTENRKDNIIE